MLEIISCSLGLNLSLDHECNRFQQLSMIFYFNFFLVCSNPTHYELNEEIDNRVFEKKLTIGCKMAEKVEIPNHICKMTILALYMDILLVVSSFQLLQQKDITEIQIKPYSLSLT